MGIFEKILQWFTGKKETTPFLLKRDLDSVLGQKIIFLPPKRKVTKVFIHCSASDNPSDDSIAVIRKWHLARGFNDVGYHYFIRKDGTLEIGRSLELNPAAQQGHNTGSIAICLHGLDKKLFTQKQFDTLVSLCKSIGEKISVTFHGHCEVNKGKTCPVFNYRKVLKLDGKGKLGV